MHVVRLRMKGFPYDLICMDILMPGNEWPRGGEASARSRRRRWAFLLLWGKDLYGHGTDQHHRSC